MNNVMIRTHNYSMVVKNVYKFVMINVMIADMEFVLVVIMVMN